MHAPLRLLILTCALALAACAAIPVFSPVATYVVVRHAEKVDDGSRDPSLTDAGRARAHALAELLRSRDVVAVYATDFRRTRDTAEPTAAVHDLSIISYDAEAPAEAVAERLRRAHATGTVLVVGHSNTVPGIVSALCGCEVAPIDESDYGNMFEVRIRDGAAPVLSQRRY
ncbi:MAG TPA: phosphoglycerate mutase family protein [Luteimonas sp.]